MSKEWPVVRLGDALRQRKEFITIDDTTLYRRPKVKLHAQGIVVRDEVPGALIKTKQQQVCRMGEFLVAEIDAKVGGFGIVPDSLDGAIVSSHYFLFCIDDGKLDRRYLDYFIRTPAFREQVEAQGSTNYAAIRPSHVLGYRIPLPPLAEQRRVVTRIEELAERLQEATNLRRESTTHAGALIGSLHTELAGCRVRKLGDVIELHEDSVSVLPSISYPQVGVRSFGGGLFKKDAIVGADTTYKTFNRLYDGALLLSQVKGWEGALAVCSAEFSGWYVSPEYRTFRCKVSEARPRYLASIVRLESFWKRLGFATRGVGARRERTRPEQFLQLQVPMPTVQQQEIGEKVFEKIDALTLLQSETNPVLGALLPAILDRAFKGELV